MAHPIVGLRRPGKEFITQDSLFSMLQGENSSVSALVPRKLQWPELTTIHITEGKGPAHAEDKEIEIITTMESTALLRKMSKFFDTHLRHYWLGRELGVIFLTETTPFHWTLLMDFIYGGKLLDKNYISEEDLDPSEERQLEKAGKTAGELFLIKDIHPILLEMTWSFDLEYRFNGPTRLEEWKKIMIRVNRLANIYILAESLICPDIQNEVMDEIIEEYEYLHKFRMEPPAMGLHENIMGLPVKDPFRKFILPLSTFHTTSGDTFRVKSKLDGVSLDDVEYMMTVTFWYDDEGFEDGIPWGRDILGNPCYYHVHDDPNEYCPTRKEYLEGLR